MKLSQLTLRTNEEDSQNTRSLKNKVLTLNTQTNFLIKYNTQQWLFQNKALSTLNPFFTLNQNTPQKWDGCTDSRTLVWEKENNGLDSKIAECVNCSPIFLSPVAAVGFS